MLIDVHSGAYGQYRQDLLDPASALHRFQPQAALFSLTAREAIAGVALTAGGAEVDGAIGRFIGELRSLWRKAREIGATVIQQTFIDVSEPLFGGYDRMVPGAPATVIARLNDQVCEAAARDGVLMLDVARASQRDGIDAWFDVGRWLQGKLEIAPQAAPLYGDLAARILAAQRGLSKKCLVLDLDNTLWGGVIGDDGLDGIVLGEGSAAGEAHLALQHYAKQLKERGVILAVCSKNDAKIAEAAFRDHPEMVAAPRRISPPFRRIGTTRRKTSKPSRRGSTSASTAWCSSTTIRSSGRACARACRWSLCRKCRRIRRIMSAALRKRAISRR